MEGPTNLNPFDSALQQLEIAARILDLDRDIHETLKSPKRTLTVSVLVRLERARYFKE